MTEIVVRALDGGEAERCIPALADVLIDCVEGGASVSFMLPIRRETAEGFWRQVAGKVARGEVTLFVGLVDGAVVGTVILVPISTENQPHRAEVSKLLVHRRARSRGVAHALMAALESAARAQGRLLLCLDTVHGSPAERLYDQLGWARLGIMPRHALWPDGAFCDTTFFYKQLSLDA
jgi:GNAT superfamily N-acetyltransferase